ncbi:hypothetical protein BT93_L4476 [Corymbia citriodora subsp. variegata]|uniref:V-type proton ATPase subunit G n=1 Tax=Corymbia citriodora subsp. variegata TaxID=360336 RepID=A0A8T0CKT8_CORYI|nr:hypothetical protein BT93_L4476 [Corymbia citriodora subsp. variegata]
MAAQNSLGIQTLLDAEREAQKIVQKGTVHLILRQGPWTVTDRSQRENVITLDQERWIGASNPDSDRTKRVKDARSEAQKEIEDYRKKKEEEFKQYEKEHSSGNEQAEKDADKDTEEKVKEIKSIGDDKGPKVVEDLLNAVVDVKPVVPDRTEQPLS